MIDGTVLTASTCEDCRKFEVIAGRVECDGQMGRRFVSAMQRPTLTRVLVAAALEQCGWVPATRVDVVTDGARGMRSLVAAVAPNIAPKIPDWFHVGMKLHAVVTAVCTSTRLEGSTGAYSEMWPPVAKSARRPLARPRRKDD